ncbi:MULTISPECIES: pLS20_p028 family conjugation system transmembrane protein [unclassified Exiguobacterium]|uniref:pLS20_p028 family conjugation system transmembrane protein n=1 Tax=unclassified Exiguobacterium TaxID=2644629 RepID=UPI001BEC33B3|nr:MULTISPECIES: hypothetical protein [unclassified Exiguobacterium]
MSNEEIARKLEDFQEYLSISNTFTDMFRWFGWVFVQGLAWCVDMLENVTDDILLLNTFYNNAEIVAFVDTIKPLLYILLAFSILYAGYLLIFQKKFDREGMVINIFIACAIIVVLNSGMDKASEFTNAAIDATKVDALYPQDESTLSGSIIQRNVTDLSEVDKSKWSTKDLSVPNSTPPSKINNINIREKYSNDTDHISREGKEISQYRLSLDSAGEYRADKLDQSGLEWNNEYYFRYSIDWFTIIITLSVMAFTLFSIALKLAKLSFELTFNYILALLIAPIDVHDGQKTKKVLQAIFNTFIVTILIFLSMKVYMIGTAYLEDTLSSVPYLIALIAFSLAVIDGPNMVERLFGIDAGLKNGWSVLAGAYAGSKMISAASNTLGNTLSGSGLAANSKDPANKSKAQKSKNEGAKNNSASLDDIESLHEATNGTGNIKGLKSAGSPLSNEQRRNLKSPFPDNKDPITSESIGGYSDSKSTGDQDLQDGQQPIDQQQDLQQASNKSDRSIAPSGATNQSKNSPVNSLFPSNNGPQISQGNSEFQSAKVQIDSDIDNASESIDGTSAMRNGLSASSISQGNSNPNIDNNSNSKATQNRNESSSTGSNRQQNDTSITRSGGNTIVDEEITMNESPGNTEQGSRSFQSNSSGHSSSPNAFYSKNNVSTSDIKSSIQGTKQTINQNSISQQQVQNETTINHEHRQERNQSDTTNISEIRQPNTYTIGQKRSVSIEKMKHFNKNN